MKYALQDAIQNILQQRSGYAIMSNATVVLDTPETDGILIVPLDKQLRMRYSTNYRWFEPPFREFTNF